MNRLGTLLGSVNRGNIVEALTLAEEPLTSYRVATAYNMNVAKTYLEMKKLAQLGMVKSTKMRRGTGYVLADEDLRRLALKLSSRVVTYSEWASDEAKKARFRAGLVVAKRISLGRARAGRGAKSTRQRGELETLALLGRKGFDSKYRRRTEREYDSL